MNKQEKLITVLMLECLRYDNFSFYKFPHRSIDITFWENDENIKSWSLYQDDGIYDEKELIKTIKDVRRFKLAFGEQDE